MRLLFSFFVSSFLNSTRKSTGAAKRKVRRPKKALPPSWPRRTRIRTETEIEIEIGIRRGIGTGIIRTEIEIAVEKDPTALIVRETASEGEVKKFYIDSEN